MATTKSRISNIKALNIKTSAQCLLLIVFALASQLVYSQGYIITKIYDGDTVKLEHLGNTYKLRLTGIDAPERNQRYGKKSRRALIKLCKQPNTIVHTVITGMDKYQRYLGRLYCNQIDVSLYLTKQGLAWFNHRYSSDAAIYLAQMQAKQRGIGLWRQKNPLPPWVWRQKYKRKSKR